MPSGHLVRSSIRAIWHCRWLARATLVALCLTVNVSFAQDQLPELLRITGSEAAPGGNPAEIVVNAEAGDVPELDTYDSERFVRVSGQQGSMVYDVPETVSQVAVVVYFHQDTEEEITLVQGDTLEATLTSQDSQSQLRDGDSGICDDTALQNRGELDVCSLRDTSWFRVTWQPTLTSCSKQVTFLLNGALSDPLYVLHLYALHHPFNFTHIWHCRQQH